VFAYPEATKPPTTNAPEKVKKKERVYKDCNSSIINDS
jgi:hypothetical protein